MVLSLEVKKERNRSNQREGDRAGMRSIQIEPFTRIDKDVRVRQEQGVGSRLILAYDLAE